MSCKCHEATFCPDLICVDMDDDDVPVFAHRNSPEGRAAEQRVNAKLLALDREQFERLKARHGW